MGKFITDLEYCVELLEAGFSIIPLGRPSKGKWDPKSPSYTVGKWEPLQTEALTPPRLRKMVGDSKEATFGIIGGYNDVEVIDIDSKFLPDNQREAFHEEIFMLFSHAVDAFYEKCTIVETISGGYHVIYRAKNIQPSYDVAFADDGKCIIETRGIGSYAAMYDDSECKVSYLDMDYITEEERDALIDVCKIYNKKQEEEPQISGKTKKYYEPEPGKLTPWGEYNKKHDVWSIVQDEFEYVGETSGKHKILRQGSDAAHSGYIFKDTGLMYLFTPNTIYPAGKALSPFMVYAYKNHGGDTSKAASTLYREGYGDRYIKKKTIEDEYSQIKFNRKKVEFPLEVFPEHIYEYIKKLSEAPSVTPDYLGASILFAVSAVIGNSVWYTDGSFTSPLSLWLALVGPASTNKTPSSKPALKPLRNIESKYYVEYKKKIKAYKEYTQLSSKEKKGMTPVEKPMRNTFLYSDPTIEALMSRHEENLKGVNVVMDELRGFIGSMNKYNAGTGDRAVHLSSWAGETAARDRVDEDASSRVDVVFEGIFGTIQTQVLSNFMKNDKEQDGFYERFLFCYAEPEKQHYKAPTHDLSIYKVMEDFLTRIERNANHIFYSDCLRDGMVSPRMAMNSDAAQPIFEEFFNGIEDLKHDDNEDMPEALGKIQSYVSRLAVILNIMYCETDEDQDFLMTQSDTSKYGWLRVSKLAMQNAVKLCEYFIYTARKLRFDKQEYIGVEAMYRENKGKLDKKDMVLKIKEVYPDVTNKKIAEVMGVTPAYVGQILKKNK